MFDVFVAQAPPPPTLMPVATAPFEVPGVDLWESMPHLVQMWSQNTAATTGLQYLILAALVVFGLMLFIRLIRSLGRDDS